MKLILLPLGSVITPLLLCSGKELIVSITLVVVGMLVVIFLVLGLSDITTLVVAIHVVLLRSVKETMQVYS